MRVAYVGNFDPQWSTENDVRLAIEYLGHTVIPLQENRVSSSMLRRQALSSDLLLFTGTWDTAQPLDETLDVLARCAIEGVPTATYHLDVFHGTDRGGRRWWLHPQMHARHVFTADGDHQDEWRRMGVDHRWLRPGVRHGLKAGRRRAEFACDVAFVGSDGHTTGYHREWPYRAELVNKLGEICARRGWSFLNPGGRHPKVDRGDMADFYVSARVTVGDSLCPRREMSNYWSDRVYEATGRGGLLIMPEIYALNDDFDSSLPMYRWGDWDSLEEQVELFLTDDFLNDEARTECRRHALKRHTYVNRARKLLEEVGL